tara:strand:+ start:207 stop:392 length:186 start_codon:yes stop_codon:yes gene_type:complete
VETVIYYNFSCFIDHRYISDPYFYEVYMRHPYELRLEKLEERVAALESIIKKSYKGRKLLA